MAGKGNVANLKPFKPGQSGNPAGRAGVLPPEIRAARKKNQADLIKLITEFFGSTRAEAKRKTKGATQLICAVQALISKAMKGDVVAFRYLVETMVGKIPTHDYDGFTEEDLRMLNRVKEIIETRSREGTSAPDSTGVGTGH